MQITRWPLFPQHIDIYYHLLTAWGFIKAGGYTNWDFWQYAPIGRPHIYPPLFHILLAALMKAGIDKIILAKAFNTVLPVGFFFVIWLFLKKNFSPRLALLSLITLSSSFSFFASLTNRMPSTMAMILGIIALGQFLRKRTLFAALSLTLCFYTHIGTAWFILLTLVIYSFFIREEKARGFFIFVITLVLSLPILMQQFVSLKLISFLPLKEKYLWEFKTIDYILAAMGFILALQKGKKHLLFISFFIAAFIYIAYPSRLFSSEGYLPIALLSAASLDGLCENFVKRKDFKIAAVFLIAFILIFSPTLAIGAIETGGPLYRVYFFDSCLMNMLFPAPNERMISKTIWFHDYYSYALKIIEENSLPDDIIYSTDDNVGVCLAAVSGRATANYLLPETRSPGHADPFACSKIIAIVKYHNPEWIKKLADKYRLILIGENEILKIYKNPSATAKMKIRKAVLSI